MVCGTCVPICIISNITINQIEAIHFITNKNVLPEALCFQTCNVVGSEVIMGATCIPSFIVTGTVIHQLETNV